MRNLLATIIAVCVTPCSALADIPTPFNSNSALLDADSIILCSDFGEINASRVSQFLSELDQSAATVNVIDGPKRLSKALSFNVLVVVTGGEAQHTTEKCARDTVPYGDTVSNEIATVAKKLLDDFEHPNPAIDAAFSETTWSSSNFYHETENWVTIVIAMREPSTNFTMITLFDQPYTACDQNSACVEP
ncbi:hypothetical protein [Roseobacter sp. MH60115]|uniref:hypothetical protein n=1 Tax=Roseobacter sp. MH60115 TaxID=2785324 RepID=UPI0018A32D1A|nr:hypothetical protein [Roseobacter sp. MH60115]